MAVVKVSLIDGHGEVLLGWECQSVAVVKVSLIDGHAQVSPQTILLYWWLSLKSA